MSELRQRIAKALIALPLGLTVRELADEAITKQTVINGTISQMQTENLVQKGEYLEGEGQIWMITEKGIEMYGKSVEVESPVVKVKTVAAAAPVKIKKEKVTPIIKKVIPVECKKETPACEPNHEPLNEIEFSADAKKISTENFAIWQMVDEMGAKIVNLLAVSKTTPKRIDDIEYKIETLESLAQIYNPKISATLRQIAVDLRG